MVVYNHFISSYIIVVLSPFVLVLSRFIPMVHTPFKGLNVARTDSGKSPSKQFAWATGRWTAARAAAAASSTLEPPGRLVWHGMVGHRAPKKGGFAFNVGPKATPLLLIGQQ